jgi:hypothetical protein
MNVDHTRRAELIGKSEHVLHDLLPNSRGPAKCELGKLRRTFAPWLETPSRSTDISAETPDGELT